MARAPPDQTSPIFAQIQTGEQRSQGVELDVAAELSPGWSAIATYAYTDARVTADNTFRVGNRMPNVARNAGSLWSRYDFMEGLLKGFGVGLGVFAVGERAGDLANTFELPGYVRLDGALYYRRPEIFAKTNLYAQVNFMNLTNTDYYAGSQASRNFITPGAPLSVIGSIKLEFY